MFKILSKSYNEEAKVCFFEIEAPDIARKAKPGQFVIIRPNEKGERIPLTISKANPEAGTIRIIFQVVGKTTAYLSTFKEGDSILDVIGPLGKPTDIEKVGTVVCVGGGTGIAVLYPITKALKDAGNHVISIIGARSKNILILEDDMREASHELHITTDDGSYGRKGFVSDVLKELLDTRDDIKMVVAIGPVIMMKVICNITKEYGVKTLVSLNPIMVDGTGMCGACRVTVGGKVRFACVDGPEFDGHQVDFDELMKRLSMYREEEKVSYERFLKGGM